jgi:NAD(P)H-dependent FMN reductase
VINISIISSSVRLDCKSNRVALYFKNYFDRNKSVEAEILDLKQYEFPIFQERLKLLKNPSRQLVEFSDKIKISDGIIVVTPEYNGGYPSSLKNVLDVLYDEWHHKPIAISTVSAGSFGGMQSITSLQFSFWKVHAITTSEMFPVALVEKAFDKNGVATKNAETDERATVFINELLWFIEANRRMKA